MSLVVGISDIFPVCRPHCWPSGSLFVETTTGSLSDLKDSDAVSVLHPSLLVFKTSLYEVCAGALCKGYRSVFYAMF